MIRSVSLAVFEESTQPILVTDVEGTVRLCNPEATRLLGCSGPLGRKCWEVARFRTAEGTSFCSARCPVQCALSRGNPVPLHRVRSMRSGRLGPPLELATVGLSLRDGPRHALLHLMLPPRVESAHARCLPATLDREVALKPLSRRETQVLQLLARGFRTRQLAASLFISPTTVRNHVQGVLRKLGLHRRLDAILWLLQQQRTSAGE